ncbi:MAG: hypothetical protein KAR64_03595, partial [Thermoplasmatales archaeon]|nr:hypothetical protein [Thermoplasmatales archaeon]
SYNDGTATPPPFTSSDHQIIWDLGTLTVGSSQMLTFTAHVDTCGFGDNVANATTDNGVYDEDYVSVEGLPIPSVDVEKKIWDPDTQSWVESIDASAGSTVRFNISIHNDGICSGLMGITVIDTLPPSLGYADDATPREPDDISPDGKQLTWSFPGPFLVCNWIYIEFNATVLYCSELDINVVNVSAQCMITSETVYDEDIASVFGQPISSIDIEKKIWDSDTMSWVESIYTPVGNTVRFNISVHNDGTCSDLTNVNVTDFLPPSLEYANSATPFEPIIWADGKHLTWEFAGPFLACNWIYIEFNATVAFVGESINVVNVSATGSTVYDEDTASVYGVMPPQPGIDIEKQVWEETSQQWVDEIRVPTGIYLTFKITVSNIGDCLLTNIVVNDTMKSQLEYRNDASVPPSSESPHQVIWNFDTMAPGDIIEITFRAETVHCCHGWNKVNVSGYRDINDETVYDEHLVKVKVTRTDDQPIVDITKQVWDAASSRWVDSISTTIGTNLTFRITINCTGLTSVNNVVVTDNLPHQLEYRNDASVPPSIESPHHVIWNFDTMAPGDIIEITYHAETVREGLDDNVVTVETSELFYDEDSVLVHAVDCPIVQLTYPSGGEELSGMVNIRWFAVDSEGWGSPDIWLYYSPDSGDSWVEIARHLENTIGDGTYKDRGEYSWSTSSLPDGNYIVRIYAYNSVGNSA